LLNDYSFCFYDFIGTKSGVYVLSDNAGLIIYVRSVRGDFDIASLLAAYKKL